MQTVLETKRRRVWTDEQLEALPKDGYKYELLDGTLIMSPAHASHGIICTRISALVLSYVERQKLGEVFDSSTGFKLAPDLLLSPDVAFVSKSRLKKIMGSPDKFLSGAPDLAIEVLSPSDRMTQINRKMDHYFEHGTKVIWLVNWQKEQVHIYTPDTIEALTGPNDTLTGGVALPGFKCKLLKIFRSA